MVIVFATLCFRLGHLPLLAPDEGRNAEVGREMNESGAWLVPTYDGVDYLDKPAFYFKTVALSLALLGPNETAARLPSALFGIALVVMVFGFCREIHSTRCGLLAAIVVATTPLYAANARTVIFDIALAFFVCAAIFSGYLAEEASGASRRNWYVLGAAAAGFATLVKGPVGFIVPGLVLLVFNAIEGRAGAWKRLFSPLNLVVFLGVTLPWFIGVCAVHRDFLHYGLVEESFHRFTSARTFHRAEPFYFFGFIVASMFFPWSLLLPEASVLAWKRRSSWHRADRLCLVWAFVVVVFFSISQSKLPGYILSAAVACGILTARLFGAAWGTTEGNPARLIRRATAVFGTACLLVAAAAVAGAPRLGLLAKPLRIAVAEAEQLRQGVVPLSIFLGMLGALAWWSWWRRNVSIAFACLALFLPLFAIVGLGVFEVIFEAKSGRPLARQLSGLPPSTELACLECFPNGLPFYLGRTATLISRDGAELTSNYIIYTMKKSAQAPRPIVRLADFREWLDSRKTPVYVIAEAPAREKLQQFIASGTAAVQLLSPDYVGAELPAPQRH